MWSYSQTSGLFLRNGVRAGAGYSGFGAGKNNPAMQNVPDVGPIPVGLYDISGPYDVDMSGPHGPYIFKLNPHSDNQMFGRAGFLIHGDSISNPGTASKGCIILARNIRESIEKDLDWILQVIP